MRMIATNAADSQPYALPTDPLQYYALHEAKSKQRIAAAMAYAVKQSVHEAYVRGTVGTISEDHYKGAERVAKAPRYM